jgi:CubicO group peptidase (beta-lactamase class C family)
MTPSIMARHLPRRTVFGAFLALGACGPRAAAQQPSAVHGLDAGRPLPRRPDSVALARAIPDLMRVSDVPGLSMAVVQNGRVVWARAFGTVNDSARTQLDTETIFEAASLSKPVFAYIVLRLVDRGEFDLDRPLFEMLAYPRLAQDERSRRITGRMVLSHGTGLPNWGGEKLTLQFDPGTAYGYSGEGFVFLQKVIEHVTGHSLEQLARREVFQPLGMTRSSFVWQERFAGNAAYAKDWLWNVAPVHRYVEANAAASLLTTATDYARFVAAVLTGRGLSPGRWREFLTPVRQTSPGISIGLGIRVEDGPSGRTFYHSGNNGRRFTSYMTGDIAKQLGFVYFTSAYNGTSLVAALAAPVLGDDHPARHRADYDRYDDPRLVALRSVQRAAVDSGAGAARARLLAIGASPETRLSYDDRLQLGAFFAGRGLAPLSVEVLEKAVADSPDSASAHLALGRALESAGEIQSALRSYQRAQVLEGDSGDAGRQIQWAEGRLAARAHPVVVARRTLERYAGQYQERTITLTDGRLHYRRGGDPESLLIPMAEDLFELETDPTLRVLFVGAGAGPARKLIEVSTDGSIDESVRVR